MRKLVTIRKIIDLIPIENADKIELAKVDGWQCVVKKGDFNVGNLAVYYEIDSFLPIEECYSFMDRYKKTHNDGSEGYRVKSIRLKGKLSQGLLLPISLLNGRKYDSDNREKPEYDFSEGKDISGLLKVKLYEPPMPAYMKTIMAGMFPTYIRKTDQERCQNLIAEIKEHFEKKTIFEVTEKIDGTSTTFFKYEDHVGVCSRNYELSPNESAYWEIEKKYDLLNKLRNYYKNIAIQGETFGLNVQNNPLGLSERRFYVFDVFDIDNNRYMSNEERADVCMAFGLEHVPIIGIYPLMTHNVEQLLERSKGFSRVTEGKIREGLVYKAIDGSFSFKAINNDYLVGVEQ